jgi:mannose-6-phosphate isomerase
VPAGRIHALGAGALVAEVQTPSDTTYRIYDWALEYGRQPRQLHIEESMGSIVLEPEAAFSLDAAEDQRVRDLVTTDYYWMREHHVDSGSSALARTPGPVVLNVTRGSIRLGDLEMPAGTTTVVPASSSVDAFEGHDAVVMEMGF